MNQLLQKLQTYQHWLIAFILLSVLLVTGYLDRLDIGYDEATARAILTGWSVVDHVVNPIVWLGMPDLRALPYGLLSLYWPSNILALKVVSLFLAYLAIHHLYRRIFPDTGEETALISAGLLLIHPLFLHSLNDLGVFPWLLAGLLLGHTLETRYRQGKGELGGWYFSMLLCAMALNSLHPAGFAFSLWLAWRWSLHSTSQRRKRDVLIGLGCVLLFNLLTLMGWRGQDWLHNPLNSLAGWLHAESSILGGGLLLASIALLWSQRSLLKRNHFLSLLGFSALTGLLAADASWALLSLCLILPLLIHAVIRLNSLASRQNMWGQRGGVISLVFVLATLFMVAGKQDWWQRQQLQQYDPIDQLLISSKIWIKENHKETKAGLTASQWPARTMLVLKSPVLPLPGSGKDLVKRTKGIDFILFNHKDPKKKSIKDAIAANSMVFKTAFFDDAGVLVDRVHQKQP